MDLWGEIRKLDGKVLRTLRDRKPFDVSVLPSPGDEVPWIVIVCPHSNMKERPISGIGIQKAYEEIIHRGKATLTDLRQLAKNDWHASYVPAILAALPGIQYQIKPVITLWIGKTQFSHAEDLSLNNLKNEANRYQETFPDNRNLNTIAALEPIKNFRNSASFGKRLEFLVMGRLLQLGFDVYQTLVDDQGIDCIVREEKDNRIRYLDIQIKARSKCCQPKNRGLFAAMDIPDPRPNYFFIFYSEQADTFWVIPSQEVTKRAYQNKQGHNAGKYSLDFCRIEAGYIKPKPELREFENA